MLLIPCRTATCRHHLFRLHRLRQIGIRTYPRFNKFRVTGFGFVGFAESLLRLRKAEQGASAAGIAFESSGEKGCGFFIISLISIYFAGL